MRIADLLPDPKACYGRMVSLGGHLVVMDSFSYLVDSRSTEDSRLPQPAILVPKRDLADVLLRDGRIPCFAGSEVMFAFDAELEGLFTYSGGGLFLGCLVDLTTLTFSSRDGLPATLALGPDRHTTYSLVLVAAGSNRLSLLECLRDHFPVSPAQALALLAPNTILASGLYEELLPLSEALSASGARVALRPQEDA